MSRYFNSFMDDSSEELEHSWGTSPKAKAREKEYNHWYYQKHKDEIAAVRKQRHEATNSYKQAEKSHDDALRYWYLWDKIDARQKGYISGPAYKDPDGNIRTTYSLKYPGPLHNLNDQARNELNNAKSKYEKMAIQSESKSRNLKLQAGRQKAWTKGEAKRILHDMKNPTARDLVEFYLDTTVAKVKKSANKAANKAKKYATKAMSTAEKSARKAKKYATEVMSTADKYATKAMSTAEKSARKAKKYATKTIKSIVR